MAGFCNEAFSSHFCTIFVDCKKKKQRAFIIFSAVFRWFSIVFSTESRILWDSLHTSRYYKTATGTKKKTMLLWLKWCICGSILVSLYSLPNSKNTFLSHFSTILVHCRLFNKSQLFSLPNNEHNFPNKNVQSLKSFVRFAHVLVYFVSLICLRPTKTTIQIFYTIVVVVAITNYY